MDAAEFRRHAVATRLVPPRGRVLIAVSGGIDSMVLLHMVRAAFPRATVAAAHFDHSWREESAADAAWVAAECAKAGVPCFTGRAVSTPAGEAAARTARYDFLQGTADSWGADRILTAHHAGDQVETILFRMARGAGTRGLAGIPSRRGRLARPLLPFDRAAIELYAAEHGVAWRDDSTNRDCRFARNRIRHTLVPALTGESRDAPATILEIGRLAAEAESCWRRELRTVLNDVIIASDESGFTLASTILRGYHHTIHARVLRTLAARLGSPLDRSGTRRGVSFVGTGSSGRRVDLGGGIRLAREFDRLLLSRAPVLASGSGDPVRDTAVECLTIPAPDGGTAEVVIGGRRVRVRWGFDIGESEADVAFDAGSLRFPLELRGWLPGDRIRLHHGSKKLKKLFAERRIGRSHRSLVPVLAEGSEPDPGKDPARVLWLPGIARSEGGDPVGGSPVFRIRLEA
ncbi:MAG TPA: tRNA lysidine(34) synthetase TilS [Longimicrobiales bacterium]